MKREPKKFEKKEEVIVKTKLSKKELSDYKKILSSLKNEMLENIAHIAEDTLKKSQKDASGDISGYTYHMADIATDNYDREFSIGIASNERELLYDLEDAIKKIDDGIYGVCEDCKTQITKERLKAVPYTRHCLNCQQKREK